MLSSVSRRARGEGRSTQGSLATAGILRNKGELSKRVNE